MDFAFLVILPVVVLSGTAFCMWHLWAFLSDLRNGNPLADGSRRHRVKNRRLANRVNVSLAVGASAAFVISAAVLGMISLNASPYAQEWLQGAGYVTSEARSLNGSWKLASTSNGCNGLARAPNRPGHPVIGARFTGASFTDEDLIRLVDDIPDLEWLILIRTNVTDGGLQSIRRLKQLYILTLDDVPISDEGLRNISTMDSLEVLFICNTKVSDHGCRLLARLERLWALDLTRTAISDAGLESLQQLKLLEKLVLDGCDVSDEAVAKLQQALPNCRIER